GTCPTSRTRCRSTRHCSRSSARRTRPRRPPDAGPPRAVAAVVPPACRPPGGTGLRARYRQRCVCGFSGEFALARRAADPAVVAGMAATMGDRGPDGWGLWAQGPVALGHRRLKIIDLTERGAQPMVDPELGLAVVFNGCVYNHHELRREL